MKVDSPILPKKWLPLQRPLRNLKTDLDRQHSRKYLLFGEKKS